MNDSETVAGGEALVAEPGQDAPTLTAEELQQLDPASDVVLFKPCGFKLDRTFSERQVIDGLLANLDWPAIKNGAVYVADGDAFFNRLGPRLIDSIEVLAACTHPRSSPTSRSCTMTRL